MKGYDPTKPFNAQTLKLIQETHPKEGPITLHSVGKRFAIRKDPNYWKDYEELKATDGIGTKGSIHWKLRTFSYGAQDAAAMVWDDLIESGYVPYEMQNHIIMQEEDNEGIYSIIKTLRDLSLKHRWKVDEKRTNPVIMSGGETAIDNTLEGFELGITATGMVKNNEWLVPHIKEGDIIIGLGSNGIHSNGLTFVRELFFDKLKLNLDDRIEDATLGEELTRPTTLYLPSIVNLLDNSREYVDGLLHITGGAFTKFKSLTNGLFDIVIERDHKLSPQPIFKFIYEEGKQSDEKMYQRFNNGVGYAAVVGREATEDVVQTLGKYTEVDEIGYVEKGVGLVKIESKFSDREVIFN